MSKEIRELASKISNLDINRRRIIADIVDKLLSTNQPTTEAAAPATRTNTITRARRPNHNFISKDGVPLAGGDIVEILSTRKVSKTGDLAEVAKFNRLYVGLKILSNRRTTQRADKYLRFVE